MPPASGGRFVLLRAAGGELPAEAEAFECTLLPLVYLSDMFKTRKWLVVCCSVFKKL